MSVTPWFKAGLGHFRQESENVAHRVFLRVSVRYSRFLLVYRHLWAGISPFLHRKVEKREQKVTVKHRG